MLFQNSTWCTGQALVQFARGGPEGKEYAVKFFLVRDAFYTEAALYAAYFPHLCKQLKHTPSDSALFAAGTGASLIGAREAAEGRIPGGRFLPHVGVLCDSVQAGLLDPDGVPLPPCIVMERGESLQDWSDRAEPDRFTAFSVRVFPKKKNISVGV